MVGPKSKIAVGIALVAVCLASVLACGSGDDDGGVASEGEALFSANCSVCHGETGDGSNTGPPLVHKIYEPGHHPDFSFRNAVKNGVPSHHWNFGDMPPVTGVSDDEVDSIIAYVRDLQREAGIFE